MNDPISMLNKKNMLKITLGIIAALLLAGAFYNLTKNKNAGISYEDRQSRKLEEIQKKLAEQKAESGNANPDEWKAYQRERLEFKIPGNWILQEGGILPWTTVRNPENNVRLIFRTHSYEELRKDATNWYEYEKKSEEQPISNERIITVDGLAGGAYDAVVMGSVTTKIIITTQNYLYIFELSPASNKKLQEILNTFKIKTR